MAPSTAKASTSIDQDPAGHASSDTATIAKPATHDEPASPILQHRLHRLSQPPERYSSELFFTDSSEPTNYHEAQQSEDFPDWQLAIQLEMNSNHANGTWDLVDIPKNRKALLCPWVYRLKHTIDSTSPKYKARIVAKGFRQE